MEKFLNTLTAQDLLPILDSISDAVFIDDSEGYALWCNRACKDLYQVSPQDIHGVHISQLEETGVFTPSVAKEVMDRLEEVTIIHENKMGKKLLTTGMPVFGRDGRLNRIITTSRDITELTQLQNQLESMQEKLTQIQSSEVFPNEDIIASSRTMYDVMQLAKRLAAVDSTVLITGESGVGKSIIARLLHENGPRSEFSFVTINCGAIPESLIESELFGYERGAFTGSRAEGKKGLFEIAQSGTIFLDEISELPLNLQVKLLQVIQERTITPVGGSRAIPIDVRIISATNKDLHTLVKQNKFREDLYYRLNVVPILVPPLRERGEDILPLIERNMSKCNQKLHENKTLSSGALDILLNYSWPGNIRELQNIIERLILTTRSNIITEDNLPIFLKEAADKQPISTESMSLSAAMDQAERAILERAVLQHKSTRAIAKALNVSQPTIVRKLRKHGLKTSDSI